MSRWMGVVIVLSLACTGMPGGTPPAPEPEQPAEPAPAEPAPAEPAPPEGDPEQGVLPKLERDADPRPSDCTLDVAGLTQMLEKTQPGAALPARMRRDPNRLVEKLQFDDGTELRVVRGGCAHISETWEMAPIKGGGDLVDEALAAFGRAKVKEKPAWELALKKGVKVGEDGSVPCGDANCTLKLEGEILTFGYDFAL